jgi:hypothetical protein
MQFDQLERREVIHVYRRRSSDDMDISLFCLFWFWNDNSILNNRIFIIR